MADKTLRDEFARAAMQQLISSYRLYDPDDTPVMHKLARTAYKLATIMVEQKSYIEFTEKQMEKRNQ